MGEETTPEPVEKFVLKIRQLFQAEGDVQMRVVADVWLHGYRMGRDDAQKAQASGGAHD